MEVLILFLLEFTLAPLLAVLILGADLIGTTIISVLEWRAKRRRHDGPPPGQRSALMRKIRRGAMIGGLVVLVLMIVGAVLLETVFFRQAAKFAMGRAATASGLKLDATVRGGSIFAGTLELEDVAVARTGHPSADFDLTARSVELNVNVLALLAGSRSAESVTVDGLRGTFQRKATPTTVPKASFRIDELCVLDADLTLRGSLGKAAAVDTSLKIDRWVSKPIGSFAPVFDVLFRTNAEGSLEGQPFKIVNRETSDGGETTWQVDALPIAKLGQSVGAPLSWMDDGVVDIGVKNVFDAEASNAQINLEYSLTFRRVSASLPRGASATTQRMAGPVIEYVNEHGEELPVAFTAQLGTKAFQGSYTIEAAGIFDAFLEGLAAQLTTLIEGSVSKDDLKDAGRTGIRMLRDYVKAKTEESEAQETDAKATEEHKTGGPGT